MEQPKVAGKAPLGTDLQAGKTYAWCSCGHSAGQPFCDGSHKPTAFQPKVFKAEKDQQAFLCMCKQTSNPPYCDGSHNKL